MYRDYIDVSVAVAAPKGLVVPVIRNCEHMSFADVEKQIAEYGTKAKTGKLSVEEMTGLVLFVVFVLWLCFFCDCEYFVYVEQIVGNVGKRLRLFIGERTWFLLVVVKVVCVFRALFKK